MPRMTIGHFPRIMTLVFAALVSLSITVGTSADGPAKGAPPTSPTVKPSTECTVLRVQLNGTQAPTQTCLATTLGAGVDSYQQGASSLDNGICSLNELRIYQDSNFRGNVLCLRGEGWANLGDYYFGWPIARSWNDRMSSFQTGVSSGKFYEHSFGHGAKLAFAPYQSVRIGSSWWNDRASSVCLASATFICP